MHHGRGETENRGRWREKESADNSPSPGKDESGIKKVLPTGKFRGLATFPFFFFNPFFRRLDSFLVSSLRLVCVCVLLIQSHGSRAGPWYLPSPKDKPFPWWLTRRSALLKASLCQLVLGLLENSESFDIFWEVALVLEQNCHSQCRFDGLKMFHLRTFCWINSLFCASFLLLLTHIY